MVAECARCPTLVKVRRTIVNGAGAHTAQIAFVGEGPGEEEDKKARPFVGKAGRVLKMILWAANIDQFSVFYSNATRCWGRRTPKAEEIDECHTHLIKELKSLPNLGVIVSLGGPALRSLYGSGHTVRELMGFTLFNPELPGVPIIPTYHPSYIMRGNWIDSALVLAHLRKAKRIAEEGHTEAYGSYTGVTSLSDLCSLRDYLLGPAVTGIAIDTETTGLSWMDSELLCISFSGEKGIGFSVPILHRGERMVMKGKKEAPEWIPVPFWSDYDLPEVWAILDEILRSDKPKWGQNIGFDLRMLERRPNEVVCKAATALGFHVNNVTEDTSLLSALLSEVSPANLRVMTAYHTDIPYYEAPVARHKHQMWVVPDEVLWEYGGADVDAVQTLVPALSPRVKSEGTEWIYRNISIPLIRCATKLEERGVAIDLEYFDRLCAYYHDKHSGLLAELKDVAHYTGEHPTYYQDMQKLLFKELKLPLTNTPTKGPSAECEKCRKTSAPCSASHAATSASVLQELYQRTQHPVLPLLVELRRCEKLLGTYLEGGRGGGFRSHIREDGRIHARWTVAGAKRTGRFSCQEPNLMNPPKGEEVHSEKYGIDSDDAIRSIFIAPPGRVLIHADWCLVPGTRVLTADLHWVPIETLVPGQELLAIDEERTESRPRKMRTGKVTRTATRMALCYRLKFETGEEIIATSDHPWLAARQRHQSGMRTFEWYRTNNLQPGMRIQRGPAPWREDDPDLRFLGGFLEGEGCLDLTGKAPILSFSQKPGVALDNALALLRKHGFNPKGPYDRSRSAFGQADNYYITSAFEIIRLLGAGRPVRLLSKAQGGRLIYEGHQPRPYRWGGPRGLGYGVIKEIEVVGAKEVISIETDCHTFLAEGFFSHNCQLEVWVMAYETQDERLLSVLRSGQDIHSYVARELCRLGVSSKFPASAVDDELSLSQWKEAHKEVRDRGKVFVFGLNYGLTEVGAAKRLGCSVEEAQPLISHYVNHVFPGLGNYFLKSQDEVLRTCQRQNAFGRLRHFPEVPILAALHYRQDLEGIVRQGHNFPIQSGGHDLHSIAHIWQEDHSDIAAPVLEIHDALLMEGGEDKARQIAVQIKDGWGAQARGVILPNGKPLGWEVPVSVQWGHSFGELSLQEKADIVEEED